MMLAFHAPPDAVTRPVTRYGKMPGRITVRQRSRRRKRKISETSRNSDGMALAPAITLNRMYHCVPISISSTEPTFRPPPRLISAISTTGNSAVAGTEAAICASGCAMRERRGLNPIATPTGMVHNEPRISAVHTRRNVAPAACSVIHSSARFTPCSVASAWNTP